LIDHFSFLHYTLGFPAGRLEKITDPNYPSPGNFWIFVEFSQSRERDNGFIQFRKEGGRFEETDDKRLQGKRGNEEAGLRERKAD
jgi:hypothetical protein